MVCTVSYSVPLQLQALFHYALAITSFITIWPCSYKLYATMPLQLQALFHYALAITSFIPLCPCNYKLYFTTPLQLQALFHYALAKRGKPYSAVVLNKAVSSPLYCTLYGNYKLYSTLPLQPPVIGPLEGCTVPLQKLVSYPVYCRLAEIGQLPRVLFPCRKWQAMLSTVPLRK